MSAEKLGLFKNFLSMSKNLRKKMSEKCLRKALSTTLAKNKKNAKNERSTC